MEVPVGTLCTLGSFQLPCVIIMTFSLMSCPGVSKLYLLGCSYWTMKADCVKAVPWNMLGLCGAEEKWGWQEQSGLPLNPFQLHGSPFFAP